MVVGEGWETFDGQLGGAGWFGRTAFIACYWPLNYGGYRKIALFIRLGSYYGMLACGRMSFLNDVFRFLKYVLGNFVDIGVSLKPVCVNDFQKQSVSPVSPASHLCPPP